MTLEISRNRAGEKIVVEKTGELLTLRVGNSPDLQSCLPVPPSLYWNSVKLATDRSSLCIVGVAGASAAHAGREAGFRRIVGIEADKEMLAIGERHFGVREVMAAVVLGDCFDFNDWEKLGWHEKYGCIFFDAYNGSALSRRALEAIYLRFLLSRLNDGGTLLFNCPTRQTMDALRAALAGIGRIGAWHKYQANWVCEINKTSS